jgi:hypothetical protein
MPAALRLGERMDTAVDIRAHIDADVHLQQEIDHALLAVADALVMRGDPRVVRILSRTLEPSWAEHVSFQSEVIFPIIEARRGAEARSSIHRLRADHADLSQHHSEVGKALAAMLAGGGEDTDWLGALLRTTIASRRSHFVRDAALDRWLPAPFTEPEGVLCARWVTTRPAPRFPLNLLRGAERPFPQLGKRLH